VWAVDIHADDVFSGSTLVLDLEAAIAGVKWVTEHADEIEVVHFIGMCAPEQSTALPQPTCSPSPNGVDLIAELEEAISESIDAGVVYVIPGGNFDFDVNTVIPPRQDPDIIVPGGIVDTDGKPGGLGAAGCGSRPDDTSAHTNWGAMVDVAAADCAGSGASPQVTAAAAVLASKDNPDSRADVRAIGEAIFGGSDCDATPVDIGAGNCDWTDTSGDGVQEPLLDVGDEQLFDPVTVSGTVSTPGWDHDLATRCVKTVSPQIANYHEDTTQCAPGGGHWFAYVSVKDPTPMSGCPGPAWQAFPINSSGSPAIMDWYSYWGSPLGPNWTVNLKMDNVYTSMPCVGPDTLTQLSIGDHIEVGGGPLPNPRSLTSSHQVAYGEWRPNGGATRLVAAAHFRWAGKERWVEVNLHSAGFADNHPDPEVVSVDIPLPNNERVVYDGAAIGQGVPSDYMTTYPSIDWKQLVQQAADEGWFSDPIPSNAQTIGVRIGVETKGDALANLWTTSLRAAGK
jgi:hypothetical protein